MPTLDERLTRAARELDESLAALVPRPMSDFRRRQRRRRVAVASVASVLAIAGLGGVAALLASRAGDDRAASAPPSAVATSLPSPTTVPERVKIGSDLFAAGYGWLDGRNFDETNVGPYMVYETETATEPVYWYYKGMDIVPIGTSYDSQLTNETATFEEPEGSGEGGSGG
jgi:hypothetical protein